MSVALSAEEFPLVDPSKIEPRAYQLNLARTALKQNTLIVLPTGLGKTVVALLVASVTLGEAQGAKAAPAPRVLVLAPTKPLVRQHSNFFRGHLRGAAEPPAEGEKPRSGAIVVAEMTGADPPAERERLWGASHLVVATPQVVRNDLLASRISLADTRLLVFDEAHRTSGDYPYALIAERFREETKGRGRVLGLTASPGGNARQILEFCEILRIDQIGIRTEDDPDVAPYVHEVRPNVIAVDLPTDFKIIAAKLRRIFDQEVKKLQDAGAVRRKSFVTATDLLEAMKAIQSQIRRAPPDKRGLLWGLASAQSRAMKINRALEYLETQGRGVFLEYMERIRDEASQKGGSAASKALAKDPDFIEAYGLARSSNAEHPKLEMAVKLVQRAIAANPEGRIIVFAHFRETGEVLLRRLASAAGVRAARFFGQATVSGDVGLTQREQADLIRSFERGDFNVLVATSVAEEGLDIPQVDHVIFYEPVPSEIRTIQRRGRTGRRRPGNLEVLIAKHTRDEGYLRASAAREVTMREELKKLRVNLRLPIEVLDAPQESEVKRRIEEFAGTRQSAQGGGPLDRFAPKDPPDPINPPGTAKLGEVASELAPDAPAVVMDDRELRGSLPELLAQRGVRVTPARLEVADIVIEPSVGIERKSAVDFGASLADGRLFSQVEALAGAFPRPILLLEGDPLGAGTRLTPEVLRGTIVSLLVRHGVTTLRSVDARESADLIASLARLASKEPSAPAQRQQKGGMTLEERQRFVIEGLPGVSVATGQKLLAHFGSIRAICDASLEQLSAVPGVGRKTAEKIFDVLRGPYRPDRGAP